MLALMPLSSSSHRTRPKGKFQVGSKKKNFLSLKLGNAQVRSKRTAPENQAKHCFSFFYFLVITPLRLKAQDTGPSKPALPAHTQASFK